MRRILYIFLTLVLTFSNLSGFSQAGYLGRRVSFSGGIDFCPALRNPTMANQLKTVDSWEGLTFFGINLKYDFTVDVAVSRKFTVGALFRHTSTAATYIEYGTHSSNPQNTKGNIGIRAFCGGFYMRYFLGRSIAPVGTYIRAELGLTGFRVGDIEHRFPEIPESRKVETGFGANIVAAFGRQHIFFDRMTFEYGMQSGVVLGQMNVWSRVGTDSFTSTANTRLSNQFLFAIYMRVGINAF